MNLRKFSFPIILGIICGIIGVILFAVPGLLFGVSIGILCGLLYLQLQIYLNKSTEPQIQYLKSNETEIKKEMGLVVDFTDTRCNYCFSKTNEVKYYCPECKKSFCMECYKRKEISGLCPIDYHELILIPENKKLILRKIEGEPVIVKDDEGNVEISEDDTIQSNIKNKELEKKIGSTITTHFSSENVEEKKNQIINCNDLSRDKAKKIYKNSFTNITKKLDRKLEKGEIDRDTYYQKLKDFKLLPTNEIQKKLLDKFMRNELNEEEYLRKKKDLKKHNTI